MDDLGIDDFDDFSSLPIKPRGKPVSPVKSPSVNLTEISPSERVICSQAKEERTNSSDTIVLLAQGMAYHYHLWFYQ